MPVLKITKGNAAGATTRLSAEPLLIGRNRSSGIRLDGDGVSRDHAKIVQAGDAWVITDLASRNAN